MIGRWSYADVQDLQPSGKSLVGIAAYTGGPAAIGDDRHAPERVHGVHISAAAFGLIGERPILGRDFQSDDDRPGAPGVVILSSTVWRSRYDADPGLIGRTIRINSVPATVIGIMPDRFKFPDNAEVWQPLASMPGIANLPRDARTLGVFGRLTDDVTLEQAASEIQALTGRLARVYPETNTGFRARVILINEQFTGRITDPAWLSFMTAGGLVVLIACANVANLLLMRSVHRSREIAIRTSLGATRWRVVRQLLIENLFLAMLGGALGLALSVILLRLFRLTIPEAAVPYSGFPIDTRVLVVLVTVCLVTLVVFGLAPALHVSKTAPVGRLEGRWADRNKRLPRASVDRGISHSGIRADDPASDRHDQRYSRSGRPEAYRSRDRFGAARHDVGFAACGKVPVARGANGFL